MTNLTTLTVAPPGHILTLHTFVPLPSSSSVPTLASHGAIPSHMVLNPEPHLRPLSIHREFNLASEHHPGSYPPQAGHTSSSSARTPASETLHHTTPPDLEGESSRPKTKSTLTEDSRPRKKQRSTGTTTSSTKPPPPLPVIHDIPPGGFNSDESEDANDREHSRSNSAHTTVVPVTNPVTPVNNHHNLQVQHQLLLLLLPSLAPKPSQSKLHPLILIVALLTPVFDPGQMLKITNYAL